MLTAVLGQLISNTATALIVIPIAVSGGPRHRAVAAAGADERHHGRGGIVPHPGRDPVNLMVMGPAGYRFGDYWKLGLPLMLWFFVVADVLRPGVLASLTGAVCGCAMQRDPLRFEEPEPSVPADAERVHVEMRVHAVGRLHHWRWRRYDQDAPALSNPVHMAVAVHDHDVVSEALEATGTNQLPLMRAVPMRSDNAFAGLGYSKR